MIYFYKVYYKSVDGVVLVYDVTDEKSFESLNDLIIFIYLFLDINYWMKNLKEHGDPNTTTILVGNKTDLTEKRVIYL